MPESVEDVPLEQASDEALISITAIVAFSLAGIAASVVGGHSAGEFSGILVVKLEAAGYGVRRLSIR